MIALYQGTQLVISIYVAETGRKLGLRIKEHKKEVDSFTAGTQTRASRARESSVTHKSVITDHAVEENHVINWNKAKLVAREAQRQTRWIKDALLIRKTPMCINRDAESYQLNHIWDQVICRSCAPSSCIQSRYSDIETLLLSNILQLCKVRSFYIINQHLTSLSSSFLNCIW